MVAVGHRRSSSPDDEELSNMPASRESNGYCTMDNGMSVGPPSHMYSPPSPSDHSHLSAAAVKQMDLIYSQQQGSPYPSPQSSSAIASLKRKEIFNQRKQREFIPDNKKDDSYWDRRRRNNEAAKRSREKRRFNDMILETRVMELTKENHILKAQLLAIKDKYGIHGDTLVNIEQVLTSMPSQDQILSFAKRTNKILCSPLPPASSLMSSPHHSQMSPQRPQTPVPTPVIHEPVPLESKPTAHPEPYNSPYHCYPPYASPYDVPTLLSSYEQSVLNLSSRNRTESFGESSCSGDSPVSAVNHESSGEEDPVTAVAANNSNLPHKLRHKIHLGEKDAATTLLSLHQHIKSEGIHGERSPNDWDDTGSSDERDSGISVGAEWNPADGAPPRKRARGGRRHNSGPNGSSPESTAELIKETDEVPITEENSQVKCELARLAHEVAALKTILGRRKDGGIEGGRNDSFLLRQLKKIEHIERLNSEH